MEGTNGGRVWGVTRIKLSVFLNRMQLRRLAGERPTGPSHSAQNHTELGTWYTNTPEQQRAVMAT